VVSEAEVGTFYLAVRAWEDAAAVLVDREIVNRDYEILSLAFSYLQLTLWRRLRRCRLRLNRGNLGASFQIHRGE